MKLEQEINRLAAENAGLRAELDRLKSERAVSDYQLIDQRDAAEAALGDAFDKVTGRPPEWSNEFGYKEAINEIDETVARLTARVKELEIAISTAGLG